MLPAYMVIGAKTVRSEIRIKLRLGRSQVRSKTKEVSHPDVSG